MAHTPRPSRRTALARLGRVATLSALAALLGPAAACKSLFGRGAATPPAAVRVSFVNQSTEQANVYAVSTSGESFRIGSVAPGRTETLTVPRSVLGSGPSITIVARRLATTRAVASGPITVHAGDEFTVTLPPSANTLTVLPGR